MGRCPSIFKRFRLNFSDLILTSQFNKLLVLDAESLTPIDVLSGHERPVEGADVSVV